MTNTLLLKPGNVYRIHGKTIGNETAFLKTQDYYTFLDCYLHYIFPLGDTLAYSLLPDRYDFLIRIAGRKEIDRLAPDKNKLKKDYSKYISKQIGNFILSYTKIFNLEQGRGGSLFIRSFKRKFVYSELHLLKVMKEIHCLPVNAKLCDDPEKWIFSSYSDIINYRASFVCGEELRDYFTSLQYFVDFHNHDLNDIDAAA